MYNAKKNVKSMCTTPAQRKDLVRNLGCFTNETITELVAMSHQITTLVEYLANMTDLNRIIPGLCCGYHIFLSEIRPQIDNYCKQQDIGVEGTNYFLGLVKSSMADALDMLCGAYESVEQCDKKVPDVVEEIHFARNQTQNVAYNYTAVVPFLKVIQRIDMDRNLQEN